MVERSEKWSDGWQRDGNLCVQGPDALQAHIRSSFGETDNLEHKISCLNQKSE